ncbi:hypothetical protein F3Y22_tig00110764pilonHSYRG00044 [Hibiscus syriacus]|uniref:Uncharacterized protein n=1 Tax=Hibiscus syriacus TaxID=106335 RepID=A0A6A2ZS85_HIBSY|nr:hypothetical protein F3Y22_tig00110764pilonHSYRG00044 [Hibiscus syriacus]
MIPPSSYLTTWDFSVDPCETSGSKFLGILCSLPRGNSTSRITTLELDSVGYDGFLPPRIGTLTALTTLDLSGNRYLDMDIQVEEAGKDKPVGKPTLRSDPCSDFQATKIDSLKPIQQPVLTKNSQPLCIRKSSDTRARLEHVDRKLARASFRVNNIEIVHNKLTGHITSLVNLEHLISIDLSDNWFSGPVNRGVLALPRLTYLNVSFNKFTKIEVNNYFGSGSRLLTLDAQRNLLQGHLPVKLVNFERLVVINLSHNQFTGEIPMGYGQRLGRPWRTLFLDHNYLSGLVSVEFGSAVVRIRGSLANNCLRCPLRIPLCRGRQRSASACHGYTQNTTNHLEENY